MDGNNKNQHKGAEALKEIAGHAAAHIGGHLIGHAVGGTVGGLVGGAAAGALWPSTLGDDRPPSALQERRALQEYDRRRAMQPTGYPFQVGNDDYNPHFFQNPNGHVVKNRLLGEGELQDRCVPRVKK